MCAKKLKTEQSNGVICFAGMLVESAVTLPIMCGYALACRGSFVKLVHRMRRSMARLEGERTIVVPIPAAASFAKPQNELVDAILTYAAAKHPQSVSHVELKATHRTVASPCGAESTELEIVRMLFLKDAVKRVFLEPANVYISLHVARKAADQQEHRSVVLHAYGPSASGRLHQFVTDCVEHHNSRFGLRNNAA